MSFRYQNDERDFTFSIGWSAWIGGLLVFGAALLIGALAGASGGTLWAFALGPVLIVAGSVIAHEVAHAVSMEAVGMRVGEITLEIWGGLTSPQETERPLWLLSPARYLLVAVSGSAINLLLAALLWMIAFGFATPELPRNLITDIDRVLLWVAFQVNLFMGVFNLLPVFPLDGGHALRSILTAIAGLPSVAGLISGIWSLSLGIAVLRNALAGNREIGSGETTDAWFILTLGAVVAFYSSLVLVESGLNARREIGRASHLPARQFSIVVATIITLAAAGVVHFAGIWAKLPLI